MKTGDHRPEDPTTLESLVLALPFIIAALIILAYAVCQDAGWMCAG